MRGFARTGGTCSTSSHTASNAPALLQQPARVGKGAASRRHGHVCAAKSYNNEAENLYKGIPVASGIIERRLMEKQMERSSKDYSTAMKMAEDDDHKKQLFRRETRTAPKEGDSDDLIEYFL